ncbi:hypothetical protein AWJ20_4988 [Sugiyamaella lignohabitans]|uniref:Uncharacterized protein n=1 Tax=Sugiyamaella lignohabitans TaxID=796027 RepID=A0A167EFY1_9ASCO|nr:uncharacterized protein AWJ20_4988 [Sugiyamaella lignohabitans]ANB14032.1 hypothetical protein AWJ20_4988 [Sugiyamaella lignohabitans]
MLYHIRFYKVPTISIDSKKDLVLKSVITITNDLGDKFFFGNVNLKVDIGVGLNPILLSWTSGMQSCNLNIPIPKRTKSISVNVIAEISSLDDVLEENPQFLRLKTLPFKLPSGTCERVSIRYDLLHPPATQSNNGSESIDRSTDKLARPQLTIAEEAGSNNLARHVWDAGLATCQWLVDNRTVSQRKLLGSPRTIVELGTGCGLVGLALSKLFIDSKVILTDLEDANEICNRNIQLNIAQTNKRKRDVHNVAFQVFDWDSDETPVEKDKIDLVVVTDCTYNPSSYDSLLKALSIVTRTGTKILLAHKYRDPDEEEFFKRLTFKKLLDTTVDYYSQSVRLLVMEA